MCFGGNDVGTVCLASESAVRAEFFWTLDGCFEQGSKAKLLREHIDGVVRAKGADENQTMYSDGLQMWSLCYASDLIDGLRELMEWDAQTPANLWNFDEYRIEHPAVMLIELVGSERGIVNQPFTPQDPNVRCPDITKSKREINWEIQVSLTEGLDRCIDSFETELEK